MRYDELRTFKSRCKTGGLPLCRYAMPLAVPDATFLTKSHGHDPRGGSEGVRRDDNGESEAGPVAPGTTGGAPCRESGKYMLRGQLSRVIPSQAL